MKVTGYDIIQRIGEIKGERSLLNDRYQGTLFQFPSDLAAEGALKPGQIIDDVLAVEKRIALLQQAQARYGRCVKVVFEDLDMDLSFAVKLLGGIDRAEKLWRQAAKINDGERGRRRTLYEDYDRKKPDDEAERLERVVPVEVAMKKAQKLKRRVSALRGAIATANAKPVDTTIIGLDPEIMKDSE